MTKYIYIPSRGDIVWAVLDPRVGHEQSGRRPVLVLSPKVFTESTGLAIVCPITSRIKGFGFEVPLQKTKTEGAVVTIHVRSIDVIARHLSYVETVPEEIVDRVSAIVATMIGA